MIDSRHRLRPERIIHTQASLFQDIKALFINMWKGLVYVFCCLHFRNKKSHDYDLIEEDSPLTEEDDQQRRPLLNN